MFQKTYYGTGHITTDIQQLTAKSLFSCIDMPKKKEENCYFSRVSTHLHTKVVFPFIC